MKKVILPLLALLLALVMMPTLTAYAERPICPYCQEYGIVISNYNSTHSWKCGNPICEKYYEQISDPEPCRGGTATCQESAACEVCHFPYGGRNPNNHTGDTEVRDAVTATCKTEGYTGDTYCLGCNNKIASGSSTGLNASNHEGGTEIRDVVTATCKTEGYTGDTYCLGCNTKITDGTSTGKDASKHEGGTEVRDAVTATCKTEGYTGDTYCLGCNNKIASGSSTGLNASNHEGGTEIRNKKDATCTAEGYTGDICCIGCDTVLESGKAIKKLDHTLTKTARVEPTCTEAGTEEYWTCSVCKKLFSDEAATTEISAPVSIPAGGSHKPGKAVRENEDIHCISDSSYDEVVYCTVCRIGVTVKTPLSSGPVA